MPIRPPNFEPPFNVVRIAYVDCHVVDPAASKTFWVDALGFVLTEETGDALYLRGLEERNHHSVVLRKGPSPDVQASYDFFTEIGFRTTEYAAADESDQLWSVWLHRKGNVHDIAFTSGRGPRFHHVGVWVPAVTDIIHACDVLSTSGWLANMERGPGRHGLSNAFFLYLRDPDGHRVELFTSDYLTIDPDHQPTRWDLR